MHLSIMHFNKKSLQACVGLTTCKPKKINGLIEKKVDPFNRETFIISLVRHTFFNSTIAGNHCQQNYQQIVVKCRIHYVAQWKMEMETR